MDFRLIFVMDLLDGVVVHAKRGEREKYVPIHRFSSIVTSSDPARVIETIKPKEVYIADLNRLMSTGNNRPILKDLRTRNMELRIMLDYGVKGMEDLKEAVDAEMADKFVLGTETISIELLEEASKSSSDIIVSVDLFNGEVLTSDTRMKIDPLRLIKELNKFPVRDVIVLELNRVGTKSGIDFEFLARAVELSKHEILCGGGVRNCEDVHKMAAIGVKGALVATAVHDGAIPSFEV
uniref:Imidazole glycerol phosphate synthase subunit HisF n=1 Tax=Candidatus Methanophaga sp. ANME-1 ERB7 TaxID=2759913 RepID=A0A7G9Z9N3_9EURY|nr:imidazole glycerol phosphate synthase subunit HisF [Methanosarcinales archaeon ANME-1 ERB7]